MFEIDPVLLETYASCVIEVADRYNVTPNWAKVKVLSINGADVDTRNVTTIAKMRSARMVKGWETRRLHYKYGNSKHTAVGVRYQKKKEERKGNCYAIGIAT